MSGGDRYSDLVRELARFLLQHPQAEDNLLRTHRDDGSGHCVVCSAGGQTGRLVWPCRIYAATRDAIAGS